ncbi:unnamed protein product [Ixodes hexagonus]
MVLSTEWAEVEAVELLNDGSGLGFGIIGGRSTGVVVKTVLPGGVADRDGRLQSGDHILQIGDVNLRGLGSDQVASVLRQAGTRVRLVVARPSEAGSEGGCPVPAPRPPPLPPPLVLPTRLLADAEELERRLLIHEAALAATGGIAPPSPLLSDVITSWDALGRSNDGDTCVRSSSPPALGRPTARITTSDSVTLPVLCCHFGTSFDTSERRSRRGWSGEGRRVSGMGERGGREEQRRGGVWGRLGGGVSNKRDATASLHGANKSTVAECEVESHLVCHTQRALSLEDLPETETFEVELMKDQQGLGITIAGYVCEKGTQDEVSGIFVKSVAKGSAADASGRIRVNDQIIEVDGRALQGYTNHQAVEVLRSTGRCVKLRLARYLRGAKYHQLQHAIALSEAGGAPPSLTGTLTPGGTLGGPLGSPLSPEAPSVISLVAAELVHAANADMDAASLFGKDEDDDSYVGELDPKTEAAIVAHWSKRMGPEFDIVVAQLSKFEPGGGLGISLEGTVDVEDGREVRPHHYIRSVLPDGPVGINGRLRPGDELLQVNGRQLLGLHHREVVGALKQLPLHVRLVCARPPLLPPPLPDVPPPRPLSVDDSSFVQRRLSSASSASSPPPPLASLAGGATWSSLPALVKAKSDGSLAQPDWEEGPLVKLRSRSLEPLTGLAMWSSEPHVVELVKGERGLGFSILDYQDPMNPSETVIVIRSLVPGGVAQQDGRLIPGDRLLFVNDVPLQHAGLDAAVQALKGAPRGVVRIGVAKPLPLPPDSPALAQPGQGADKSVCTDVDDLSAIQPPEELWKASSGTVVLHANGNPLAGLKLRWEHGIWTVSDVEPGSVAALHGELRQGDIVLSLNDQVLSEKSQGQVAALLAQTKNVVFINYLREVEEEKVPAEPASPVPQPAIAPKPHRVEEWPNEVNIVTTTAVTTAAVAPRRTSLLVPPTLSGVSTLSLPLSRRHSSTSETMPGAATSPHVPSPLAGSQGEKFP